MKMLLKRSFFAGICMALAAAAFPATLCGAEGGDIVILFESDVHCGVEGYTKLAALKNEAKQKTDYVSVVSCGDFVQGGPIGAVSEGEYIIEIMNAVGYDAAALGNHEFDYTIPRLKELTDELNAKTLSCNFVTTAEGEPVYDPYTVISCGGTDVAFIGITTPESISKSTPVYFTDERGEYVYDFCGGSLYEAVQNSIDAAKADGADYIVALSHLGTEYVTEEWSAQAVAAHTAGIDVMLDGHSHSVIEGETVPDMNGEDVLISSVGTKFEYIGRLTIDENGGFTTELIETAAYEGEDETVSGVVSNIEAEYGAMGDRVVGKSEVTLTTLDENGDRAVRNAETNIGDFCADAFRIQLEADIGIMNGGGIRGDIAAGDVTYNDILGIFPYGNSVSVVEVSGQSILDMLEHSVKNSPEEAGGFLQVSGVKFNVNTSIESTVTLDENDMFTRIAGERRVGDVYVLNGDTGEYEPIDVNGSYKVASIDYLLKESGSGYTMFDGAEIVNNAGMLDTQVIEDYIKTLGGTIGSEYSEAENRISIIEYVPMRAAFEALGYTVSWYSETPDCAFAAIDGRTIMFKDKSDSVTADGSELPLALETYMENGTTYISSDVFALLF